MANEFINGDWNNHRCPNCGGLMILVPFYNQWIWACGNCGIEDSNGWHAENRSSGSENFDQEINDDKN